MARERKANGTAITAGYPTTLLTLPIFYKWDGTPISIVDEVLTIPATGLMTLQARPFSAGAVKIYTGIGLSGDAFTIRTDQDPQATLEVLVEPDGDLTFHADQYETTAYATYSAPETVWPKTYAEEVYTELRALQLNGGRVIFGKCNDTGGQAKGDCCYAINDDGTYFWYSKAVPPQLTDCMALATIAYGDIGPYMVFGEVRGLAEEFGANAQVFVSTGSRPTTTTLGSAPTVKQYIGHSIANGVLFVNITPWPQAG